tara:strand:- start:569 stop:1543 length:975 start_codon:yes stop_codon:yes gene_type:complete
MSASRVVVQDPAAFGKVAVLMGGWSAEREVSLWSGKAVLEALKARQVDAHGVDAQRDNLPLLKQQGFARAFNIVHGTGGEDGILRAVMDLIEMPCTGSGVLASALAMDKLRTKRVWQAEGLPTPDFLQVSDETSLREAALKLGYPLIIKPSAEGSSVGISKVRCEAELMPAFGLARGGKIGTAVMAERFIDSGDQRAEYTAGVLASQSLPIVRIEPDGEFYDYNAKYVSDKTQYHCPAGLTPASEAQLRSLCLKAFNAIGASGWGRIDFMLDRQDRPWLIEANLVPGMTSHSLVPMAAREAGISFQSLCWNILETSMAEPGSAS